MLLGFALLVTGCGLPADSQMRSNFESNRSTFERVAKIALQRAQASAAAEGNYGAGGPNTRFLETSDLSKDLADLNVGKGLHVEWPRAYQSSEARFDIVLYFDAAEAGFPIALKRKGYVYYGARPMNPMLLQDSLDEYEQRTERKSQREQFRKLDAGWYLFFAPL